MSTLLRYMVVWWISVVSSIRPIVLLYSKMFIIYYIISIFGIRFLSNICYSFQSNTHYLQIFGIRINRILESILYSVQSNIWYSIGECQSKIEYFRIFDSYRILRRSPRYPYFRQYPSQWSTGPRPNFIPPAAAEIHWKFAEEWLQH